MPFPSSPTNGQLANINNISYSYNSTTGAWSKTSLGTANVNLITSNGGTISGPVTLSSTLTFAAGSVGSPSVSFTGSTSSGMYAPGSNSIGIATNGANAIVINSSQQVGIGTNAPIFALDVETGSGQFTTAARIKAATHASSRRAGLLIGDWLIDQDSNGNGVKDLAFYDTNAGASRLTFDTTGNVGIGTGAPAHRLHVYNASSSFTRINNSVAQIDVGVFANALVYSGYASSDVVTGTSNGTYRIFTAGTERVRVDATGNVGIGSTNPQALVHLGAGTALEPQLEFDPSVLTSATNAGSMEYDGNVFYMTPDTASGRAVLNNRQIQYMTADFGPIGPTIGNYFGATGAIYLQPDHTYLIEGFLAYTKNTAGTVTFTLNSSLAPVNADVTSTFEPGGGGAAAGSATLASTSTSTSVVSTSLTNTTNYVSRFAATIETNVTGNSLVKIQVACSAGSVTVKRGSFWSVTKLQGNSGVTGNTGAFIAG